MDSFSDDDEWAEAPLNDVYVLPPFTVNAAQTSNQLSGASGGLEGMLNMALGAYSTVSQTKLAAQQAKIAAQQSAVSNSLGASLTNPAGGVSQKTLLIAGGVLAVGAIIFLATR
jgi:VIT1/CCC1 family predicted Fe2+/Mn2+ transporter